MLLKTLVITLVLERENSLFLLSELISHSPSTTQSKICSGSTVWRSSLDGYFHFECDPFRTQCKWSTTYRSLTCSFTYPRYDSYFPSGLSHTITHSSFILSEEDTERFSEVLVVNNFMTSSFDDKFATVDLLTYLSSSRRIFKQFFMRYSI